MKITAVRAIPISIPFKKPFVVWRGVAKFKDHVIVQVDTDEGITGIGEASPFLYYASETQQDVVSTVHTHIAPLITDLNPFDLEYIGGLFHQVIDGHHFSKCAVEMALWDIVGKKLDIPVYQLLGGRVHPGVPVVAILQSGPPSETAREAEEWVAKGFRRLKVKIGFGLEKDVAMVKAVRQAVGDDISIRVDAEENYDLKASLRVGRVLEGLGVELFSQPIWRDNYQDMAVLRESVDIPILLDESIVTPEDVLLAARLGTGDLVNIKVVKSGGILNAKRMAAIAGAAGKACLVGSMLEMGPGTLFAGNFAVATPNVTYASEIVGPLLLTDDILTEPLTYQEGVLQIPERPGLGIELDPEKIRRYAS